ncbi:MurR/RpiR family transcriptional regulator [Achromobacter aloeverae]|uniref:MurR/RpiR family transcriptional regulator n=1 Tax=Achromobacter aloeverae TaxID=1750518 RepID=A0A4Q1HKC2_9BURK|nr:MurR/RpiR family transcriptional regulator [Achromobacter aloeverae]RXN90584.1 MurR/RpiR family transcriptional regulator [Achromobacter aloeverae]
MDKRGVDELIARHFAGLPPMLQRAARYAVDNPKEIALNSMRAVAGSAGVQASAMHRLARQLGFDGYDAMRDVYRTWLAQGHATFADRASALQRGAGGNDAALIGELLQADARNLDRMNDPDILRALLTARDVLAKARHIYIVGLRSLFPAAFYLNYACGMFRQDTTLLAGMGGIFADELRGARKDDALVVFSYEPYARDTVAAVEYAREKGVRIVSVTDSAVSPVAVKATALIVVENATKSLFPSVVPALSVAQTLAALLVAHGGAASVREVRQSEAQLRQFSVYVTATKAT